MKKDSGGKSLRIPDSFVVRNDVKVRQVSACRVCEPTAKIDQRVENSPMNEAGK